MRGDDVPLEPRGAAPAGRRRARRARVASSSTNRSWRTSDARCARIARRAGVELRGSLAAADHQQLHALGAVSPTLGSGSAQCRHPARRRTRWPPGIARRPRRARWRRVLLRVLSSALDPRPGEGALRARDAEVTDVDARPLEEAARGVRQHPTEAASHPRDRTAAPPERSESEHVAILRFGFDIVGSGCPRKDRARGGHRGLRVPADRARPWKATCAQFRAERRFDGHLPRLSLGWSTTIRQTVYEVKPSASSCFEATRPGPTKRVSHRVGA